MKNYKILLTILALFLISSFTIAQSVWVKKPGEYYTQIGGTYYSYNSILNNTSGLLPLRRAVTHVTVQSYSEFGIAKNLMGTAILPLQIQSTSQKLLPDSSYIQDPLAAGNLVAPGNFQLALTYGFRQDKAFRLAAKMRFDLRTTVFKPSVGLRSGESTWGFAPSLLAGYGHKYFFASTELGYTYRTNGYSMQLSSDTQFGTCIKGKYYIVLSYNMLFALASTNYDSQTPDRANVLQTATYLNNKQYLTPALRFGYNINKNWSLWASAGGLWLAAGRDLGASMTFNLSIAYKKEQE